MNQNFLKIMAVTLALSIAWLHPGTAHAMLAPVDPPQTIAAQRAADTQTVQRFLEQKQVVQKLSEHGFTSREISSRLGAMTDSELHQVASRIQYENPAGDGGGVVITVLVIGILALLFVYLLKRV